MFDIGGGREKINMEAKLWYGGEDANKIISFMKIALQAPKMGSRHSGWRRGQDKYSSMLVINSK